MTITYTKEEFLRQDVNRLLSSTLFIYPTDTIYGIGCNAENAQLVERLRRLKGRQEKPFSIIPPSLEWVEARCLIGERERAWLEKLPGPYTLVFAAKAGGTIAIRRPANWFTRLATVPIISTSANRSGLKPMTSMADLDPKIRAGVDFIIDGGPLHGSPSVIVRLDTGEIEVIER